MMSHELYHHGILGQRWGVRRFQNKDGTLTPEGKKRYYAQLDSMTPEDRKTVLTTSTDAETINRYKHELTNQELQDRINRINLEQRLSQLVPKEDSEDMKKAEDFVKKVMPMVNNLTKFVMSTAENNIKKRAEDIKKANEEAKDKKLRETKPEDLDKLSTSEMKKYAEYMDNLDKLSGARARREKEVAAAAAESDRKLRETKNEDLDKLSVSDLNKLNDYRKTLSKMKIDEVTVGSTVEVSVNNWLGDYWERMV